MSDDSEDEVYSVEKIVDHKIVDNQTLFCVRWEGYSPDEDTWEPFENLKDCTEAVNDYLAEYTRKFGNQASIDLGSPDKTDSSDSVAGAKNATATCPRLLPTTGGDERPSTSTAKQEKKLQKFRRISRIILSSDSDDGERSSAMLKEDASKIKTSETVEFEKKSKAKASLPVKISNSQQLGKTENIVTNTVGQQTKHAEKKLKQSTDVKSAAVEICNTMKKIAVTTTEIEKKTKLPITNSQQQGKLENRVSKAVDRLTKPSEKQNKKSTDEISVVRPISFVQDALKPPKQKKDKPKVKPLLNTEKMVHIEHDHHSRECDPSVNEPKLKSGQKSKEVSNVKGDLRSMACNQTILQPKPKPIGKSNRGSGFKDTRCSTDFERKTDKPKKKSAPMLEKPVVADSHSSSPTEFLKTFHIPKVVQKVNDDCKKREQAVSVPSSKTEKKSAVIREFSGPGKQPSSDQRLPGPKTSIKRLESSTANAASVTYPSVRIHEKFDMHHMPTFGKIIQEHSKMPQTQCKYDFRAGCSASKTRPLTSQKDEPQESMDDVADKLLEFPVGEGLSKMLLSSPQLEDTQSCFQDPDEASNSSCPNTFGSLLTKTEVRPMTPDEDTLPFPTTADEDTLPFPTTADEDTLPFPTSAHEDTLHVPFPTSAHVDTLPSPTSAHVDTLPFPTSAHEDMLHVPFPTSAYEKTEIKPKTEVKHEATQVKREVTEEVIKLLHNYAKNGVYKKIAKWYDTPGKHDWEMVNPGGSTILMQAAVNGRKDIVELLLLNGADANARQSAGMTLMMLMCENVRGPQKETLRCEIVEMLITCGGKMNLLDPYGETALMKACKKGSVIIVKSLLNFGADFYIKTKAAPATFRKPMTALDFAKIDPKINPQASLEIVQLLSTHEAKVTAAFDAQVKLVLNNSGKLLEPLFDPTIFSCFEDTKFTLSFDYNEQTREPDTGLLLFVAHALISLKEEIQCRMYGDLSAVTAIRLNGVRLVGIAESQHVLSFWPVKEGTNELEFDTTDLQNSDVKLIVRAYKVQLLT